MQTKVSIIEIRLSLIAYNLGNLWRLLVHGLAYACKESSKCAGGRSPQGCFNRVRERTRQTWCVLALVTIYISGPGGQYATNVEATSSHDAVRKGVAFFLDPFWKRPKPKAGAVLRLCPMGGKEIHARVPPGLKKKLSN